MKSRPAPPPSPGAPDNRTCRPARLPRGTTILPPSPDRRTIRPRRSISRATRTPGASQRQPGIPRAIPRSGSRGPPRLSRRDGEANPPAWGSAPSNRDTAADSRRAVPAASGGPARDRRKARGQPLPQQHRRRRRQVPVQAAGGSSATRNARWRSPARNSRQYSGAFRDR